MAITSTITDAFKRDLLKGIHTFATSGGNTFKLALYTSAATLNASTASYITAQTHIQLEAVHLPYQQVCPPCLLMLALSIFLI